MPQVIEILDNVIIGIHKCKTNVQAIDLFKSIIKENIHGADRWPDEDFNSVVGEGYIMLDGQNGSICLNME